MKILTEFPKPPTKETSKQMQELLKRRKITVAKRPIKSAQKT
jgi:hypothetical protein